MASSSTPDHPGDRASRLALEEVEEAEAILDQRPPKAKGPRRDGRGGGWGTAALAAPGLIWTVELLHLTLEQSWTLFAGMPQPDEVN